MTDQTRREERRRLGGSTYDPEPIPSAERDRWREGSWHPAGPEPGYGNPATEGHEGVPGSGAPKGVRG